MSGSKGFNKQRANESAVIEEILPPGAAAAEAFDDCAEPDLFPEERAVVARAVASRQREFATTRRCAWPCGQHTS
jgi:4'-phosphopantetheinyl transferase EntD